MQMLLDAARNYLWYAGWTTTQGNVEKVLEEMIAKYPFLNSKPEASSATDDDENTEDAAEKAIRHLKERMLA